MQVLFRPLVDVLKSFDKRGIHEPWAPVIGNILVAKMESEPLNRVGCRTWDEYAKLAEQNGIVELIVTGPGGNTKIRLR